MGRGIENMFIKQVPVNSLFSKNVFFLPKVIKIIGIKYFNLLIAVKTNKIINYLYHASKH